MHFVAVVLGAAVLDAVAPEPLRDAVAGRETLEVVRGLAQQRHRRAGAARRVLHLGPDYPEALEPKNQ